MILSPSGFHSGSPGCGLFCTLFLQFVQLSFLCSSVLSADFDLCPSCHISVLGFGTIGVLFVFGSLVLGSMSSVIGSRLLFRISFNLFYFLIW